MKDTTLHEITNITRKNLNVKYGTIETFNHRTTTVVNILGRLAIIDDSQDIRVICLSEHGWDSFVPPPAMSFKKEVLLPQVNAVGIDAINENALCISREAAAWMLLGNDIQLRTLLRGEAVRGPGYSYFSHGAGQWSPGPEIGIRCKLDVDGNEVPLTILSPDAFWIKTRINKLNTSRSNSSPLLVSKF